MAAARLQLVGNNFYSCITLDQNPDDVIHASIYTIKNKREKNEKGDNWNYSSKCPRNAVETYELNVNTRWRTVRR